MVILEDLEEICTKTKDQEDGNMLKKESIILLSIIIIPIIVLLILSLYKKNDETYDCKIYFFNAGKADAILISKNDKYIMIDTGEESLSDEILRYFETNNIKRLEYLIITHFDKDHVGSASSIIDNIEIGEVLQSNYPKDSVYYTNYLASLAAKSITPTTVSGLYSMMVEDINISVNGPEITFDNNESNNSSLIVSITNGNNKFLFMGDAENARIKDFLSNNNETYDFIKIPYHGNYLKQLDNLLESTKPQYGVMTCSSKEGCEEQTFEQLTNYNVKYYMTNKGAISILSNGEDIIIKQ